MKRFAHYGVLAATLAGLSSAPAEALPVFTAEAYYNGTQTQFRTGFLSAGAEYVTSIAFVKGLASAGGLSAVAQGRASYPDNTVGGAAVVTATFDDFVVSGPSGSVSTSFNMLLSGTAGVITLPPLGDRQTQATAAVIVKVRIDGQPVTGDAFFEDRYRLYSLNDVLETQPTGMLAGWSPPGGVITTPSFTVETGVPFSLSIGLRVTGGANNNLLFDPDLYTEGTGSGTLTFAAEPVFNLPPGYSVDSPSARVSENRFVPEPFGPSVSLAGATVLGLRRWRLSRR